MKFCPKCGKELGDHIKFCTGCGENVSNVTSKILEKSVEIVKQEETICNEKKGTLKAIFLGLAIIVVVAIAGFMFFPQMTYRSDLKKAQTAMEEKDYETAIKIYNELIDKRPEEAENYVALATAYVETFDLYKANKTLKEGYETTNDESLREVSIWGPMTDIESAYYWLASMPVTHQEYYFSETGVEGRIYFSGRVVYKNYYSFNENGLIERSFNSFYNTYDYIFGGEYPELNPWYGYDFWGDGNEVLSNIRYVDNVIVKADIEGEPVEVTFPQENQTQVFFEDSIMLVTILRNNENQISEISFSNGETYIFNYSLEGNWTVSISGIESKIYFDSQGRMIEFYNDPDSFRSEYDEQGRIIKITYGDEDAPYIVNYSYTEEGQINCIETEVHYGDEYDTAILYCEYNDKGQLIHMEYDEENSHTVKSASRDIEYDAKGRLIKMIQKSDDEQLAWESEYTYNDNLRVAQFVVTRYDGEYLCVPKYTADGAFSGFQKYGEKISSEVNNDGGYWFDTVHRGEFYVPIGFKPVNTDTPAVGYIYKFENEELDMIITVSESTFEEIGIDMEPSRLLKRDYENLVDSYGDGVTYNTINDDFSVISGYTDSDTRIFYNKNFNLYDLLYINVNFEYPRTNNNKCDVILTDFLDNLHYS